MKKLNLNKVATFLGLLLLLFLTYFRENFLLEINASLALDAHNRAYSYWLADFFQLQTQENLIKWKWVITIFFSSLMSIITMISLRFWFESNKFVKMIGLIYLFTFIFIVLLGMLGFLLGSFNDIYFILRKILGFIQSPIPFFTFFVLIYWSYEKK